MLSVKILKKKIIFILRKNWLKEFEYIKIHENDLNEVLMNYFCVHRMYDVALEFQKETNIKRKYTIK